MSGFLTARRCGLRIAALVLAAAVAGGCSRDNTKLLALTGGNPDRAPAAIQKYGCGSCHEIPGIAGARADVGPPLGGVGERAYVGGVLTNTPDNLVRWIMTPRAVSPRTAMPELGVTEGEARDIAAYLYSLK